ncbi:hypothetical protein A2303_02155 [Candidatus Falkowbacteria bacterium RIFOXYB2_FULL_47_14]|uniref:ADP-ribosylglycohydrolase n=1 Tax=Candidatus Falkowbacteria bacterium RIFOXYA2_FULL_47_19 TaxID=1797994 RepID=A0A1F5SFC4_9BACT|nr:MAG: hypothetical protein A2227_07335 [Candidatus Falkowbacteria bacterium RIFOXYA2_FULL_47_19]OGF35230.1 MAG: hypothetical protein A2468_00960 [Candidatus Falkowbacteria bacterium RIFOXYC2_FULL_46_15]OGF43870.1 MAG: hypothetical protein A2303_02155 [Candidatus Falkowbacteria bacterium RIFOXYB2_FULL_47_14]
MREDKIRGLIKGVAIGDQLGMAVETYDAAKIRGRHGRITGYIDPDADHKWFKGLKSGITDDWQQSAIVARSIIGCGCFDPEHIASRLLEAYWDGKTFGWGRTTRQAMKNMVKGSLWREAGVKGSGGNGVLMKTGPVAAYFARHYPALSVFGRLEEKDRDNLIRFTVMTHNSDMAVAATFTQLYALVYLLNLERAADFSHLEFLAAILDGCDDGYYCAGLYGVPKIKDSLFSRLEDLASRIRLDNNRLTDEEIINGFGGGQAYIYDCLPFIYAFFLRNPYSIKSLYDVVSAGGDTDTNGSILASMLGALNGDRLFPARLADGLSNRDEVFTLADEFSRELYS